MTWRSIKDDPPPKDENELLVWHPSDGAFVAFWHPHQQTFMWTTHDLCGDERLSPTHWMPLPEPPDA